MVWNSRPWNAAQTCSLITQILCSASGTCSLAFVKFNLAWYSSSSRSINGWYSQLVHDIVVNQKSAWMYNWMTVLRALAYDLEVSSGDHSMVQYNIHLDTVTKNGNALIYSVSKHKSICCWACINSQGILTRSWTTGVGLHQLVYPLVRLAISAPKIFSAKSTSVVVTGQFVIEFIHKIAFRSQIIGQLRVCNKLHAWQAHSSCQVV